MQVGRKKSKLMDSSNIIHPLPYQIISTLPTYLSGGAYFAYVCPSCLDQFLSQFMVLLLQSLDFSLKLHYLTGEQSVLGDSVTVRPNKTTLFAGVAVAVSACIIIVI